MQRSGKEIEWSEIEAALYRSLSRLAVTAYGLDRDLDRSLDELREGLRSRRASGQVAELVARVERASELKPSAPRAALAHPGTDPPRLIARLFGSRAKRSELAADLDRSLGGSDNGSGTGVAHSPVRILEVLGRLLERLEPPERLAADARRLQERLAASPDLDEVPDIIIGTTRLVGAALDNIRRERGELERFLYGLNDRLEEIGEWLAARGDSDSEAATARRNLGSTMTQHMQDLRTDVDRAVDLDALKGIIYERVSVVESQLTSHMQSEEQRQRDTQHSIRELTEKLTETQADEARLRTLLEETRRRALRDGLTGVYNRAAFDDRLEHEFARSRRQAQPLAFMLWDIDRFKQVNDTYGHPAGDRILQAVAERLAGNVREVDFVARYGGEEFALVLPATERDAAVALAEKLREAIETIGFLYRGEPVSISASCGVVTAGFDDTPETMVHRADQALYRAKRNGRNRVEEG